MGQHNIDDYDLEALAQVVGDERTRAEDILLERLDLDDGRAAKGLAFIGSTRALLPLQRKLSRSSGAHLRVAAGLAMHQLGDDTGRDAIIEVLKSGFVFEKMAAASALSEFKGPEAETALLDALSDPEEDVKSGALMALVRRYGLLDYQVSFKQPLCLMYARVASPLPTVRAQALAELRAMVAGLSAGRSAEDLGIAFVADETRPPLHDFIASLQNPDAPALDLAGLQGLDPPAQKWVEDLLMVRMATDPRAAAALTRLGVKRAEPALAERETGKAQ